MSVRINLLPHREMRRERRKKDFLALTAAVGIAALLAAVAVAVGIDRQIAAQHARNDFIRAENAKLDEQIKEIASLRAEIDALRARKLAVESLQANRTLPVHLMDELVRHTPEGLHLKTVRQEEGKVFLAGYAQSNERVSELLRNLAGRTPWLERPELIEIKAARANDANAPKSARRMFEFSLNALVKAGGAPAQPVATTALPGTLVAAGASANR